MTQDDTQAQHTPGPELIYRLAYYYDTKTFLTSVSLGVYTALAAHPLSSEDLARRLSLHTRPCEVLLNALVALELLRTEIDPHTQELVFANTPISDTFLVEGRPEYIGEWLKNDDKSWSTWGDLENVIRGYGRHNQSIYASTSPELIRIARMDDIESQILAPKLVDELDITDESTHKVLDIGGGSGRYGVECCRRGANITATVFDRLPVRELFDDVVRQTGMLKRMNYVVGDFNHDVLPRGYDLALLVDVLHLQGENKNRDLLWRVRGSLEVGGRIAVRETLLNDNMTSPRRAALFSVNVMAHFPDARCYSTAEIAKWLTEAGFDNIRMHDTYPGLITAKVSQNH